VDSKFIDEITLAFIMTFNVFNPSVNLLQAFKLIFNFQAGGIILLEYDVVMVNLKLFSSDELNTYAVLIFIIGSVLLVISVIDMRR
jgi:Polycystin cation channel